jgi:hypothetical protein
MALKGKDCELARNKLQKATLLVYGEIQGERKETQLVVLREPIVGIFLHSNDDRWYYRW